MDVALRSLGGTENATKSILIWIDYFDQKSAKNAIQIKTDKNR